MSSGNLLVIHGGDDECRRRLRSKGIAYWASGIGVVLEKHGYLDFETAAPDRLHDPETWSRPRAVVVAGLSPDIWTDELAHAARTGRAQVLVEGPLEVPLQRAVGVRACGVLPDECVITVRDAGLKARASEWGAKPGGVVAPARSTDLDVIDRQLWPRTAAPIEPAQAAAWRAVGWSAERWELEDEGVPEVLAEIAPRSARASSTPAVVRRGSLTACCYSLLAHLAQVHTSEPADGREWRSSSRTLGLELMFLELLDRLLADARLVRHRVLPWPRHAGWVLNIRHDVDRTPLAREVAATLERHDVVGTRATWYWRAHHLSEGDRREARRVLQAVRHAQGHEVALHTEELWTRHARSALRTIERAAQTRVRGSCAHGERTCFRYQGAANQLWADRMGLAYTEMLQHAHMHPHRFLSLEADGLVRPLNVICLPHHESFDVGTSPGEHRADLIAERAVLCSRAGGLIQVMNHPDIHAAALFEMLEGAPDERRLDWTAGEATTWWSRTHVAGALAFEAAAERPRLRARESVSGVVVESRRPDGSFRRRAIDLPAGGSVEI